MDSSTGQSQKVFSHFGHVCYPPNTRNWGEVTTQRAWFTGIAAVVFKAGVWKENTMLQRV